MFKSRKSRLARGVAAFTVAALGAVALATGASSPANADPKQYDAFVGMGSNTIQDVMNAYAGEDNGTLYTPLKDPSSGKQLVSFDAINPVDATATCIIPKLGAPAVLRPNGSGAGLKALSNADGGNPGGYGSPACGTKSYAGLIDFARSSDGPTVVAGQDRLRFIPIGRDYVGLAFYRPNGGAANTDFTKAQITQLYTTGHFVINGVDTYPCAIQGNSGTWKFFINALGVSDATAGGSGTSGPCNAVASQNTVAGTGGRIEENDALAFKSKGDTTGATALPAGVEIVIPFSVSSFIARANNVAPNPNGPFPAAIKVGNITDGGGLPYTGSAPGSYAHVAGSGGSGYSNATFGRDVYVVIPTSVITDPGFADLKAIFVDTDPSAANNAAICSPEAITTKQAFGFATNTAVPCGDATTNKSAYKTGNT